MFVCLFLLIHQHGALRLHEGSTGTSKAHIEDPLNLALSQDKDYQAYLKTYDDEEYPMNLGQLAKELGIQYTPDGGQNPDSKSSFVKHSELGGKVVISNFNGGFGNQVHILASAISFGFRVGATTLDLQLPFWGGGAFDLPAGKYSFDELGIQSNVTRGDCKDVDVTQATNGGTRWWYKHCKFVPISEVREIVTKFLRPRMTKALASCVAEKDADDDNVLTIHYRQGRLANAGCQLAEAAIAHKNFSKVLVVTVHRGKDHGGMHPCVEFHKNRGDKIRTNGSAHDDMCTLMRAKNLVMSDSTYTEALALLSPNLKNMYHRLHRPGSGDWNPLMPDGPKNHDFKWCTDEEGFIWEGTQLFQTAGHDEMHLSRAFCSLWYTKRNPEGSYPGKGKHN